MIKVLLICFSLSRSGAYNGYFHPNGFRQKLLWMRGIMGWWRPLGIEAFSLKKSPDYFISKRFSHFPSISVNNKYLCRATISDYGSDLNSVDKDFSCLDDKSSPRMRQFLPLPGSLGLTNFSPNSSIRPTIVRILQFNVLADGLSGLCPNKGFFSRIDKSHLEWSYRKDRLLNEIVQYDPDIITMQEVDHFYDFFLPNLNERGYVGYFAPKPTSACLEVNGSADGCALFVKDSKLRVVSCESKTLALSIAELSDCGELQEDNKNIMAQNQVALIAICELVKQPISATNNNTSNSTEGFTTAPPIIVGTTHLKSSKSPTGERYRQKGVLQILNAIQNIYFSFAKIGRPPVVIFSGDFNAVANREGVDYDPLTYRAVKGHSLQLRSVYNEDVPLSLVKPASSTVFTTWKARKKNSLEGEKVVKRSIDYIFYMPFKPTSAKNGQSSEQDSSIKLQQNEKVAVIASSSEQIGISSLLRFTVYFFSVLIPLTSLLSTEVSAEERLSVLLTALLGLFIFERFAEGSIFRPRISPAVDTNKLVSSYNLSDVIKSMNANSNSESTSLPKQSDPPTAPSLKLQQQQTSPQEQPQKSPKTAEDAKLKSGKKILGGVKARSLQDSFLSGVASISQQIQPLQQLGRPGIQAVSALDMYSDEQIGAELMPSRDYPSDHLSIAADLQLMW
mmetsp:Transcript_4094/g.5658  ORF Transcript_4094/g.5658 Transcript_4094/m.5658 type:complete len:676 (+) Transcript_4094:3-2030(+)